MKLLWDLIWKNMRKRNGKILLFKDSSRSAEKMPSSEVFAVRLLHLGVAELSKFPL